MRPVSTSCADHMGAAWARIHTWDGTKWVFSSDWLQADESDHQADGQGVGGEVREREEAASGARRRTASPDARTEASPGGRPDPCTRQAILLDVNGIEVIYNHVILVLKGVSLQVPEGKVVALLGGNGAGKTTTLRAVSNLLRGERGEVTKGSIELRGERIERLSTSDMVERGVIQVMEGRHCFAHLTIEENLMTGAYTRKDGKAAVGATLEKVYRYFPRLKERRSSQAAYTSGGEQQMCAIGRALMANPKMVLLDEPSMGLAPQIVEEVFEIVKDLNQKEGVTFLLAEQNTNMALRYADYGYILESGRVVMDGAAASLRENEDVKRVLPRHRQRLGRAQELPRREELQAPQALAVLRRSAMARADAEALKPLAPAAAPAARDQGREGEERRHLLRPQRRLHPLPRRGRRPVRRPEEARRLRLRPLPAGDAGRAAQAGRGREAARAALRRRLRPGAAIRERRTSTRWRRAIPGSAKPR